MITLFAPTEMNMATGYGKVEAGLLQGFVALGTRVTTAFPTLAKKGEAKYATKKIGGTVLVAGSPEWGNRITDSDRLVSFTMSESTRVSKGWVDALNERFEAVCVPCPPLVEVYRDSGVQIPIHYVPLGVDLNPPHLTSRRPYPAEFTFLAYTLGDMRKGAHLAMLAFDRLFRDKPGVRLIIKARDGWDNMWIAGLDEPHIEVIGGETSEADWHALLARVQCLVFPSYGEGFGLPPREAVLAGLPVIATRWLGLWDVEKWGYALPVGRMLPAQFGVHDANAEGAEWAEADIEALDRQMLYVHRHYAHALLQARRGRVYLMEHFTWKKSAREILRVIGEEGR